MDRVIVITDGADGSCGWIVRLLCMFNPNASAVCLPQNWQVASCRAIVDSILLSTHAMATPGKDGANHPRGGCSLLSAANRKPSPAMLTLTVTGITVVSSIATHKVHCQLSYQYIIYRSKLDISIQEAVVSSETLSLQNSPIPYFMCLPSPDKYQNKIKVTPSRPQMQIKPKSRLV